MSMIGLTHHERYFLGRAFAHLLFGLYQFSVKKAIGRIPLMEGTYADAGQILLYSLFTNPSNTLA